MEDITWPRGGPIGGSVAPLFREHLSSSSTNRSRVCTGVPQNPSLCIVSVTLSWAAVTGSAWGRHISFAREMACIQSFSSESRTAKHVTRPETMNNGGLLSGPLTFRPLRHLERPQSFGHASQSVRRRPAYHAHLPIHCAR